MCVYFYPLLIFLVHSAQALRGWSLWQSIRRSVQLWRQSLCCGWYWSHAIRLHAARSAVSYEPNVMSWSWLWTFPLESFFNCLLLSSLCCTCRDGWTGFRLQRLYFVWVCRELQSFYWFAELLCALHHKVRTIKSVVHNQSYIIVWLACGWLWLLETQQWLKIYFYEWTTASPGVCHSFIH